MGWYTASLGNVCSVGTSSAQLKKIASWHTYRIIDPTHPRKVAVDIVEGVVVVVHRAVGFDRQTAVRRDG
jgi:hypothetical protein